MNKLPDKELYGKKICGIIHTDVMQVNNVKALKYNYVDNTERGLRTFLAFAKKFPGATHVNFYNKKDRSFIEQHKF